MRGTALTIVHEVLGHEYLRQKAVIEKKNPAVSSHPAADPDIMRIEGLGFAEAKAKVSAAKYKQAEKAFEAKLKAEIQQLKSWGIDPNEIKKVEQEILSERQMWVILELQ